MTPSTSGPRLIDGVDIITLEIKMATKKTASKTAGKTAAKTKGGSSKKATPKKAAAKKVLASKKGAVKKVAPKKVAPVKAPAKKAAVKRAAVKKAVAQKATAKKVIAKKVAPKKAVAKKVAPSKAVSKKSASKKTVSKKIVLKKIVLKKAVVKKAAPKKVVAKKAVAKKVAPQKAPAKKVPTKVVATKHPVHPSPVKKLATSSSVSGTVSSKMTKNADAIASGKNAVKKPGSASPEITAPPERRTHVAPVVQERRVAVAVYPALRKEPKERLPFKKRTPLPQSSQAHTEENMIDTGADPGYFPKDEVLDEAEQAQWIQLREQAEIAVRARALNAPETHPDFDGEHCVECDEVIPTARLILRRVRCVDCQGALEESNKLKSRTFAAPAVRDGSSWD